MRLALVFVAAVSMMAACSGGRSDEQPNDSPLSVDRCIVRLHGKGGDGSAATVIDGVGIISPTGNASGWNGRQWIYFPHERYEDALAIVSDAVAGCGQIILNGFSNGGAFATKMYCRGETFGGRLATVVIDDPVTDSSAEACEPGAGVRVTLYWTGALEPTGKPGRNCREIDWTCDGGRTLGIAAFADMLGAKPKASPFDEHTWYLDAPELSNW